MVQWNASAIESGQQACVGRVVGCNGVWVLDEVAFDARKHYTALTTIEGSLCLAAYLNF